MKTLVYQSCCTLIALWTFVIVVLAIGYFLAWSQGYDTVLAGVSEKQRQTFGISVTFLVVAAAASLVMAWGAVVVPFALIAILARPHWHMTPVSETGTPIQLERKAPSIGEVSRVSAPPG